MYVWRKIYCNYRNSQELSAKRISNSNDDIEVMDIDSINLDHMQVDIISTFYI